MVVKTFRGLLADGGQDQIRLQTNKGKVGYKIVKFEIIATSANVDIEGTVKIYLVKQTTVDGTINLTDGELLAAGTITGGTGVSQTQTQVIIFDTMMFNQDIFITSKGADYTADVNYYIELEVIPLTDHAAEFTTLKDIRTQRTIT